MLDLIALIPKKKEATVIVANDTLDYLIEKTVAHIDDIIASIEKPKPVVLRSLRTLESYGMVKNDGAKWILVSQERVIFNKDARGTLNKNKILAALENNCEYGRTLSTKQLAEITNLDHAVVRRNLSCLQSKKIIKGYSNSNKRTWGLMGD